MILLYHDIATHGQIATPAMLGREHHAPRRYAHEGHFVPLDGPAHVIAHDAEDICKIPGYRLATPAECDAYHAGKRQKSAIHEAEEPATDESAADPDDTGTDAEDTAPTRGRRK